MLDIYWPSSETEAGISERTIYAPTNHFCLQHPVFRNPRSHAKTQNYEFFKTFELHVCELSISVFFETIFTFAKHTLMLHEALRFVGSNSNQVLSILRSSLRGSPVQFNPIECLSFSQSSFQLNQVISLAHSS